MQRIPDGCGLAQAGGQVPVPAGDAAHGAQENEAGPGPVRLGRQFAGALPQAQHRVRREA
ncbi:hypothetical protein [Streptomyces canus]|uniref:hypothetical protein n=1 Tax=Streptomyces canus TaxID=58343 RepID=UPI0032500F1E